MIRLFSQNKKVLTLATGFGLLLLLMPFYFAEAFSIFDWCGCTFFEALNPACWLRCLAETILSIPIRIIFLVIAGVLGILALVTGLFYAITVLLINWLIGIIMSVGIVPGKAPLIIGAGWEFSRQFANLFFILALAFIGLATILRIKDYEAKKALPTLIIIALLINFTPVIVGFVVDMGNIVTNFFLEQAESIGIFPDILNTAWTYLKDSLYTIVTIDGKFFTNFPYVLAILLSISVFGLVLIIFFNLGLYIYLLIGAVFFCRTVILWILMILSPIAFLSKVFPPGRTTKMIFPDILHWDKWWQSLIQWTIIGIPISFFLYLSNLMITHRGTIEEKFSINVMRENLQAASSIYNFGLTDAQAHELATTYQNPLVDLFAMILAPTVALVLLAMGALISLKVAPEGAKGIMRFATEKGIKRGWGGISSGISAVGRSLETYRAQTKAGATIRQALKNTALQPLYAWGIKKRPTPPPAAPAAPKKATAPAAGGAAAIIPAKETGGKKEGLTGEERLERRQRLAQGKEVEPLPPTPPPAATAPTAAPAVPSVSKKKQVAKKIGKGGIKWGIVVPAEMGWRAATGVLAAAESIATKKIDKELKIGKQKKEEEEKEKTKNCPFCSKEMPIDSVFCPYCRERVE